MSENRVPDLVAALAILYTISVLFTALRVYVRVFISKNWGADDSLLVATLVGSDLDRLMADELFLTGLHRGSLQYIRLRLLLESIMVLVVTFKISLKGISLQPLCISGSASFSTQ